MYTSHLPLFLFLIKHIINYINYSYLFMGGYLHRKVVNQSFSFMKMPKEKFTKKKASS